MGLAIDKQLRVNRVRVARRNAVPHVREAALIRLPTQFRSDFERANELAHGAGIRKYCACPHALSSADCLLNRLPSNTSHPILVSTQLYPTQPIPTIRPPSTSPPLSATASPTPT